MKFLKNLLVAAYRWARHRYHRTALIARLLLDNKNTNLTTADEKIFCISMQRTGTTSVGKFLRDFNCRCAGWVTSMENDWSMDWYNGDFEKIFSSPDFKLSNAFEDAPWFYPDFYKILYRRFPNSKFILFTRNPDSWFKSMVSHSKGNILGKSRVHAKIYRRETEYFDLLASGRIDESIENRIESEKTMKINGLDQHYKDIYCLYTTEVQDFFNRNSPASLFVGRLEDADKWQKLGAFLGIEVPDNYDCHENASNK